MEKALSLFEWTTLDGGDKAVFIVKDSDEEEARVELGSYDSSEDEWVTERELGSLKAITNYSIPNSFLDD